MACRGTSAEPGSLQEPPISSPSSGSVSQPHQQEIRIPAGSESGHQREWVNYLEIHRLCRVALPRLRPQFDNKVLLLRPHSSKRNAAFWVFRTSHAAETRKSYHFPQLIGRQQLSPNTRAVARSPLSPLRCRSGQSQRVCIRCMIAM